MVSVGKGEALPRAAPSGTTQEARMVRAASPARGAADLGGVVIVSHLGDDGCALTKASAVIEPRVLPEGSRGLGESISIIPEVGYERVARGARCYGRLLRV